MCSDQHKRPQPNPHQPTRQQIQDATGWAPSTSHPSDLTLRPRLGDRFCFLEAFGEVGAERAHLPTVGVADGYFDHAAALRRALVEASR